MVVATEDGRIDLCPRSHLNPHLVRKFKPMWLRPSLPTTSSPPECAPKVPKARFCAIRSFSSGPIPASGRLCRVHFCYQLDAALLRQSAARRVHSVAGRLKYSLMASVRSVTLIKVSAAFGTGAPAAAERT